MVAKWIAHLLTVWVVSWSNPSILPLLHACRECNWLPRGWQVLHQKWCWDPLHAGVEADKQGIYPGFETQCRHHQKSKTGVSLAPQKGLVSSKNFFKKVKNKSLSLHSKKMKESFVERNKLSFFRREWQFVLFKTSIIRLVPQGFFSSSSGKVCIGTFINLMIFII